MAYTTDLKFLLKCENNRLLEEVNNVYLEIEGSDLSYTIYDNGGGYLMKESQYAGLEGFRFDIDEAFSLSFWLYPSNPGVAINPFLNIEESIKMPVFSVIKDSLPTIYLYEKTLQNNQNKLTIDINNAFYSAITPAYDCDMLHHFFIVYKTGAPNGSLTIYIDGSPVSLIEIGLCPTSINGTGLVDLYINKNKTDIFQYQETYNRGYIDDIAIFNQDYDANALQNLINYSIDYIADEDYSNVGEKQFGILFDDPATIRITSMIDDMSYVFIARNDGKIFRGSPLFWRTRKVFSNPDEQDVIEENIVISQENPTDEETSAAQSSFENGFLKIRNSIIRL